MHFFGQVLRIWEYWSKDYLCCFAGRNGHSDRAVGCSALPRRFDLFSRVGNTLGVWLAETTHDDNS